MGIRGGSAGEIMQIINRTAMPGTLLRPSRLGIVDDIQLWYRISSEQRYVGLKKFLRLGFRVFKLVTGTTIIPTLSLAIKTR